MSCAFDNRHQYKRTSTKSTINLVFFSTMINEPEALIQFIMVTERHHSSVIVMVKSSCVPSSGKHPRSQAMTIHLLTTMNVTFTQLHWSICPCINPSLSFLDDLQMQSSANFLDSRNTLFLSLQMGFFIQEDPFLAYYSTMLNNSLTGSTVNMTLSLVTTFIRLVIANIATIS